MDCFYTSCRVTCRHCAHAWTYMGSRLMGLGRSRRPVQIQCPRCHNRVKLDAKNAV